MKRNKFIMTILTLILVFSCNIKVSAFISSTGVINQQGNPVTTNGKDTLALKYYELEGDKTAVFCTQFRKTTPAGKSLTCEKTNWPNNDISVGVAYIIRKVGNVSISGDAPSEYYYGELAINEYLCNSGVDTSNTCVRQDTNQASNILNKSALEWYNTAITMKYIEPEIEFSSSQLTFSKDGDNYVSNEITITNEVDDNNDAAIVTSNIGTVMQDGKSFKVSIPVSSISPGSTVNVTVSASVTKTNYLSQNYNCGASYQTITPNYVEPETKTATATATGSITAPEKGKLIINKYDENNIPLSGATILVSGAQGYNQEFVTNGSPIIIENLEYDTYAIEETNAPSGYIRASAETVVLTQNNLTATINIVNTLIKIDILKIDENEKPLEGAIIKLMDKDGNTLEICKDENGNNTECRWVTTENSYRIEGIAAGTYYLKEISTPKGYNVNPNKIKIVIDNAGKVTIDNKEIKNNLIKISNELTTTKISKISAVNGKELPGATLEILDSKKEKISCIIKNDKGEKETLKECKWVSKDKATMILGLEAGKYYLSETIAPEGYELNTNMVEFEIKADGTITEVEMKNELSVKVPDTLSARSALLIAISMFDIALGIGIITYVKKNKVEE